jgi:hypothetical protein
LTALWLVLRSLAKLGESATEDDLLGFAGRSGLRAGGLPIRDGYRLANVGGFVEGKEVVRLTPLGHEALSRGEEDEPSKDALRVFLSVLTLRYPPSWVAYWQGSPDSLNLVLPDSERQLLEAASIELGPTPDDLETWAWWDALERVPQGEETAAHRKALGDAGEELTLNYERARLRKEGFPELAARVRWVARESAAYGFDVLSFFGVSFGSANPEDRLAIEVKANALVARPAFQLFLTDHEWTTATHLASHYIFHLWDGVTGQPRLSSVRKSPFILTPAALQSHLPSSPVCGETCCWKSSFIVLSLDT